MKNQEIIHQWSVICDKSLIEQNSNLLSLLNITEGITVSNLAKDGKKIELKDLSDKEKVSISKEMSYVTMWRRNVFSGDLIKKEIRLEWISPKGTMLLNTVSVLNMEKDIKNLRMIFNFNTLVITVPGTYVMRLSLRELQEKNFSIIVDTPVDVKVV